MKAFRFFILSVALFTFFGCSVQFNQSNSNANSTKSENVKVANNEPITNKTIEIEDVTPTPKKTETSDNSACYNLKRDDLLLDKKQTFAIDFKPFEKSCFVTFHNAEFDNPALGAQFFIYQNGKEVFEFSEQFGGANTMCWVDAVAFEDLNNDQLQDVMVVGKCGAKSSDYNENMVYLNTGKDFVTDANSNAETMDFSKVGQIRDFVKKNPTMFSK